MQSQQDVIFTQILARRIQQDQKHGGPEHDDTHTENEWLELIYQYVLRGKAIPYYSFDSIAKHTVVNPDYHVEYEMKLIDIAALAIAALESSRRKREHVN